MRIGIALVVALLVASACGSSAEELPATEQKSTAVAETPPTTSALTALPQVVTTTFPSTTTTSQVQPSVVDTTPPGLTVSSPAQGERVDQREHRFTGTTEPGAQVTAAGRYPVAVGDDGNWAITLTLNPGGNVATLTAADAAGNASEIEVPVYYDPPLELRADGIGPVPFNEPMESAMEVFIDLLGPPSEDNVVSRETLPPDEAGGPYAIFMATAYPGRDYARFVSWDAAGLMVMFSDYIDEDTPNAPTSFNGWVLTNPGEYGALLTTAAGVGAGSSLLQLEAAYGVSLDVDSELDDLTGAWHFRIDTGIVSEDGNTMPFWGRFDSNPSSAPTHVSQLQAGFAFDEC